MPSAPSQQQAGAVAGILAAGLAITLGLAVAAQSVGALSAPGGVETALGRVTGLVGTYLMLVLVVLVARLPMIERVVGQDRLVRWHRLLGPWPLVLIAAHGVLITAGYAQVAHSGFLHQLGVLLSSYTGVLAATVAFGLFVLAGVTSARAARRRMKHETWWTIHLYMYLALALSFSHQIATGASFVGHPAARAWWTGLFLATAGVVLVYRVGLPLWRSLRHGLRVVSVEREAPGVVSLILRGRGLHRLAVAGGQFMQWRILRPGLWWQAHPYSLSALPAPPYLRVTVKDLGDHSGELARLKPGTRVAVEGPYGAFTAAARGSDRLLLAGAGVGVTPLRALLEDLPPEVEADVLVRASSADDLNLEDEIAELVARRGGRLHELIGPREQVPIDAGVLRQLVPDIADRDVYVCGPGGFAKAVRRAARRCGVARTAIHREEFAF